MKYRNVLRISAQEKPYVAIIEPWAEEYEVSPGQVCQVVAVHPNIQPSFEVEIYQSALVVYVLESGSTYEFWRGGAMVFHTPIPIPGWPGSKASPM